MFSVARLAFRAAPATFGSARRTIASSASAPALAGGASRPTADSTSAIDFKSNHRSRPPPLPQSSPRNISAEEAVSNILYNTPPPSLEPFKKHVLNCLVQNEPGVLSRVSGILAGRGFNIDSLVVCSTEVHDLSRMFIVLTGQEGVVEQARRQLEDLVPVWAVIDYTDTPMISRELLLVKLSILGPDYLDAQLSGGPTHEPWSAAETMMAEPTAEGTIQSLAQPAHPAALTPAEALLRKTSYLQAIATLAKQFDAKLVDVSEHTVIVEMSGKSKRVDAFLKLVRPFGILESARTGVMAMPRTPIRGADDDNTETLVADLGPMDASLLPPG
ncbi:small subunit of acetolactate synthase-domain-containing protein [Auriculariales sp. MPI-PUGE-AT-0066]|nr:small subunit of acetolactate synthase-domain-containing protein [Auriculariales sp. MPI-PUGE-AT-0066]